jgi:cupin fold WbuC family metalloprotein
MLSLTKESNEVFRTSVDVSVITHQHITLIKDHAISSQKRRSRICLHPSNDALVHEMFIALAGNSYVKPHRHLKKSESFHLVEGDVGIILFDEIGNITKIFRLSGSANRYYRSEAGIFHTVVVLSEIAVIHEVSNGPFIANETEYANFAPDEGSSEAVNYQLILCSEFEKSHE